MPLLRGARPAWKPGSVAGERRRPAGVEQRLSHVVLIARTLRRTRELGFTRSHCRRDLATAQSRATARKRQPAPPARVDSAGRLAVLTKGISAGHYAEDLACQDRWTVGGDDARDAGDAELVTRVETVLVERCAWKERSRRGRAGEAEQRRLVDRASPASPKEPRDDVRLEMVGTLEAGEWAID